MSVFLQDGVYCVNLSGFTTRQEALAAGFKWLAPILTHDPAAEANRDEILTHGPAYEHEGWVLCGWGTYGQSDTPENDARAALKLCRDLTLHGWIANGEAWAEGANIGYSSRFLQVWHGEGGSSFELAVSCLSSDTDQWARDFDYEAWIHDSHVVMPQVYGNEHPGLTVNACLGMLSKAHVPQSLLNLTYGTYLAQHPVPYADYQGWSGPRSVYVGDGTDAAGWPKLARSAARSGTPPLKEKPMPDPLPPLSASLVPYTGPVGQVGGPHRTKGSDVIAMKRAFWRRGDKRFPGPADKFDPHYNANLEAAWDDYDPGKDGYGQGRWQLLRAMPALNHPGEYALDQTAINLIQQQAAVVVVSMPDLGPVRSGGVSVLEQDLTHATDGLPLFPAFDDCFGEGKQVVAPEDLTVDTKLSSSNPGLAFYATGKSGLRYWFGHLTHEVPLGTKFKKGEPVGVTCHNTVGGGPHCHVGVNAESYLGKGREFVHHTDYTHGAPTIRTQLEGVLA